MPFDATPTKTDLKPIDRLIQALGGSEPEWWYFGSCQLCAIQVAHVYLGTSKFMGRTTNPGEIMRFAEEMELPVGVVETIFTPRMFGDPHNIRPRHVAQALKCYRDRGLVVSPYECWEQEGACLT